MSETQRGRGQRWLRRFVGAMGIVLLLIVAGVVVHLAGIRLLGGVEAWHEWQDQYDLAFLGWRLMLYGITARGWWWMRTRLLHREPTIDARRRLCRAEVAAVAAIVLLEGSTLWQHL